MNRLLASIAIIALCLTSSAFAQENGDVYAKQLLKYDIEELMDISFVTATRTDVKFKEAPAKAYVITD